MADLPSCWKNPVFKFKHPFGAKIIGPTQAGKSHFVIKLIQNAQSYTSPPPEEIFWAYGEKNIKQV